jgi:hypothetical protein
VRCAKFKVAHALPVFADALPAKSGYLLAQRDVALMRQLSAALAWSGQSGMEIARLD